MKALERKRFLKLPMYARRYILSLQVDRILLLEFAVGIRDASPTFITVERLNELASEVIERVKSQ